MHDPCGYGNRSPLILADALKPSEQNEIPSQYVVLVLSDRLGRRRIRRSHVAAVSRADGTGTLLRHERAAPLERHEQRGLEDGDSRTRLVLPSIGLWPALFDNGRWRG